MKTFGKFLTEAKDQGATFTTTDTDTDSYTQY